MKIHSGALKHGVAAEDAIQAAEWALWIEPLDDGPPARELRLGFDTGHGCSRRSCSSSTVATRW